MQKIDKSITEANLAREIKNKAQMKAIMRHPLFRGSMALVLIFAIVVIGVRVQATLKYNKATEMPSSASELVNNWNSIISECEFRGTITKPQAKSDYDSVRMTIELGRPLNEFDWSTTLGQEIRCFSDKALGIDLSKKLDMYGTNNIDLRNSFSIFGDYEYSYIALYWNY
jgi:hypothetical protein